VSQETLEWLNVNTLIGFTEKRGKDAWHYRAALQGAEPNHYPEAIPVDDVLRRLFDFEVVEVPLTYEWNGQTFGTDRKLMVADDNGDLLGVFKEGYQGHSYKKWLLDNVASIIDDDLNIGSAGLLKRRAQAWVGIEMPDSLQSEGVEYRPYLIACTSFDGSLATTYKMAVQFVECDNTLTMGLAEAGRVFKVRHSRYSNAKLTDVRNALEIVHTMGEDFAEELAALTAWKISEPDFNRHMELMIPEPKEEGRAMTTCKKKRAQIITLYREDERVAPWNGTALGVVQAYNTWNHHFQGVRGEASRGMRNMENVINGRFATADEKVISTLAAVTGVAA